MSDCNGPPRWLPHRTDQLAVALSVLAALAAMAAWWAAHGGWRADLIEIDRADPLTAKFEVDINSAEWPELLQLPGVGPKMAQRIVESRQTLGPFADQDDLRRVHGIGPKTMERIRPYLRAMPGSKNVAGN
jgi:competence protein ComEA